MVRNKVAVLASATVASLSIFLITPPTKALAAQASCNTGRTAGATYQFDGWQQTPSSGHILGGATVTSNAYSPNIGSDIDSVWSMLVPNTHGSSYGFAQVGLLDSAGTLNFFIEYQYSNGITAPPLLAYPLGSGITTPSLGTSYSYNTLYDPTTGNYTFTIKVGNTNYSVAALITNQGGWGWNSGQVFSLSSSSLGWSPYGVEIFGEVHDYSDQMFGDAANHVDLASSGYYDNGAWQTMAGAEFYNTGSNRYGQQTVGSSNNHLQIWDWACPTAPLHPGATIQSNGNQYVFWQTPSGGLGQAVWNGSSWGTTTLGATSLGSSPTATVQSNGYIDVFWKGTDGNLHELIWNGSSWSSTYNLGYGPMGSEPSATAVGNNVYVYWRGTDNGLYEGWWNGSSWSTGIHIGTSNLVISPVSVVANPSTGEQDVFWNGQNSYVNESVWNGTSWSQTYLGYCCLATMVSPVRQSGGSLDLFWQGTDNKLWEGVWNGTSWSSPINTGFTSLGSPPTETAGASNYVWVYWKGTNSNNDLYQSVWTGGSWSGPYNLGGGPLG